MRRAANVDVNQREIVNAVRAAGLHVALTHQLGRGFPDCVVTGYSLPLNAVAAEVKRGHNPADIRQRFMRLTQRPALALRLEQAARHLQRDAS